jgi:hypothetical protein
MNRLSVAFLVATGLALTAYFGTTAWRLSESSDVDIGTTAPPALHTGWHVNTIKK